MNTLFRIANRIASTGLVTCYKYLSHYRGKTVNGTPGYVVCDLYDDGLAYVRLMGIANPIYTFAISGLEEWPDDDIVGMSLPEHLHSQVDAIRRKFSNDQIKSFVEKPNDGALSHFPFEAAVHAFRPGWVSRKVMAAGVTGEAIVTIPVTMKLADGALMADIIQQVAGTSFSLHDLLTQLKHSSVPYDNRRILAALGAGPDLINEDRTSWDVDRLVESLS